MFKFRFTLALLVCSLNIVAQKPTWVKEQLMEPAELAMQLNSGKEVPIIICVGPGASIPGSIDAGAANEKTNIKKLNKQLSNLPANTKVVVYCGCCPFEHCPNAKPAMDALKAMNFTNYFLLDLPNNLKQDWIDKGYPVNK